MKFPKNSENRFELWANIINENSVKSVAEVGVWRGDFAESILNSCSKIEEYAMIDPWANLPDWNKPFNVNEQEFNSIYNEAMEKTDFAKEKRKVYRGKTSDVVQKIPDESLDLIYIDGDHTLRGITIDLIKLLPKVRKGGYLCGDDFTVSPWQHDQKFEPTLVCPYAIYFAEAMNLPIYALPHQQFLIGNNDEGFSFTDTTGNYRDLSLNKFPSVKNNLLRKAKRIFNSISGK